MRGPIPDKPSSRPKVPEVCALLREYYKLPDNCMGGSLHIVTEDSNLEDGHLEWCRNYAIEQGDDPGRKIAEMMLAMTGTQRRRIVAHSFYPWTEQEKRRAKIMAEPVVFKWKRADECGRAD